MLNTGSPPQRTCQTNNGGNTSMNLKAPPLQHGVFGTTPHRMLFNLSTLLHRTNGVEGNTWNEMMLVPLRKNNSLTQCLRNIRLRISTAL